MIRWSPSSADRVKACPASAVLPQTYQPAGPAAERGTRIHTQQADAVDALDPHVVALPFDWTATRHVEVAYAYDLAEDTGRILGYRLERRYPPVSPTELKGSADLTLTTPTAATVIDWKTGHTRGYQWQTRVYALAASRAHRVSSVETALVYLDANAIDRERFGAFALAAIRRDVVALQSRIERSDGTDVSPGDHCRWCPAKPACPAWATELASVRAPSWEAQLAIELSTPERLAFWHRRLPLMEGTVQAVREGLRAAVEKAGGSASLGDGTALRLSTQTRTSISVDDVLDELSPEVAADMRRRLSKTTTYTQLRKVKS